MLAVVRRAALALIVPAALAAQSMPSVATVHRLADSLGRDHVAKGFAPSVAIGIVRGKDTIMLAGFGKADLENDVAATGKSVYRIGSVTKQFTSAAIMQLVEQGKIKLDDSVATYVSKLPEAWQPVTIRQLLNHTSGIPSYTGLGPLWQRRWREEMRPDTILAMAATRPLDFPVGSAWRYNNSGYVLLGMVIEKVTGNSWASEIESRFARPLGLTDTRNCGTTELIPRRVHGYEKTPTGWENAPFLAMTQPYAAGAMCSTAGDLARWNRALASGKVVSPASYTAMTTPEGAAVASKYGFGLGSDTLAGRTIVTHGGGIHGFITGNAWVPGAELSVTVLTNAGSGRAADLTKQLVRAALGAPLDRPPAVTPLSAADRERYVGVYSLMIPTGTFDFTIAADSGTGLTAQLAGQGANPLIHYGNHVFGASFDPNVRITFIVENGKATGLTLLQGGRTARAARK